MSEDYTLALFRKKLKNEDNKDEVLELLRDLINEPRQTVMDTCIYFS